MLREQNGESAWDRLPAASDASAGVPDQIEENESINLPTRRKKHVDGGRRNLKPPISGGILAGSRLVIDGNMKERSRVFWFPLFIWYLGIRTLMMHNSTWSSGLPFIIGGLVLAFISEVMQGSGRYNVAVLIILLAGMAFRHFPAKTVRPQLIVAVFTSLSFFLDFGLFLSPVSNEVKAITALIMLAKILALYQFLWMTDNAVRVRKYFVR
jgi:hypothetical protein